MEQNKRLEIMFKLAIIVSVSLVALCLYMGWVWYHNPYFSYACDCAKYIEESGLNCIKLYP